MVDITPTKATKIARWMQVFLYLLQVLGGAVIAPLTAYRRRKSARRN